MNEIIGVVKAAMESFTVVEGLAVLFGLLYLILATKENILCWYAAFISTALSMFVFWDVDLIMESGLQIYYLIMAVYGWYQ